MVKNNGSQPYSNSIHTVLHNHYKWSSTMVMATSTTSSPKPSRQHLPPWSARWAARWVRSRRRPLQTDYRGSLRPGANQTRRGTGTSWRWDSIDPPDVKCFFAIDVVVDDEVGGVNIHLLVLPLKVLVAGNDPLFSKETRGEIDVDSQVNHLAGNILYFYIFPQEINRQVNHLGGKFLHLVYRNTPVYSQMYTQAYTKV